MTRPTSKREIGKLQSEISVLRLRLKMANETLQVMKRTSDRDWGMILHLMAHARRRS